MVADLRVELLQNALVDAREYVSRDQRFGFKLIKARRELQFILHGAAQRVQVLVILAGAPFMDNAVTVSSFKLMLVNLVAVMLCTRLEEIIHICFQGVDHPSFLYFKITSRNR